MLLRPQRTSREVQLDLQLEIQSNGVWVPWPFHPPIQPAMPLIAFAKWHEMILPNETKLIHPVLRPNRTSMDPMRLHGFVSKEKLGAAAWLDFVMQYVKTRWLQKKPPKITGPPSTIVPAGASVKVLPRPKPVPSTIPIINIPPPRASQFRFYYTPVEFFTSSLCLTNDSGPLTVLKVE